MTEKRKEDENNSEDEEEQLAKSTCGKTVTLQMLLDANILTPGKENMSIEYMGQKFIGDLLEDGKIKSHETETIFCSPSAWAINCKKIINPEKKSGCGWASVRYNGKKLDIFKAQYHKKVQKKKEEEDNDTESEVKENLPKLFEEIVVPEKQIQKHPLICNRTVLQDINMLVETVPFSSIGRIQPFSVNVSISALLVMDFHCHLTSNEVCGYFGGTWDFNSHNLTISHCFPLLNTQNDREHVDDVEAKIQKMMTQKNVELVGWYHSHHRFPAFPTLKDCDKQLNYQIKLRGTTDMNYTPCIGFIHASYDEKEHIEDEAKIQPFWVLPPPENRPYELGKPLIVHTTNRDVDEVSDEIKEQMKSCYEYYEELKVDLIDFKTAKFKNEKPVLEKLKNSIFYKLPPDEVLSGEIWNWILDLLRMPKEDSVEFPKTFLDRIASLKAKKAKLEEAERMKNEEIKEIKSSDESVAEPVKVPTPSAVLPLPANYKQSMSSNSTSFSSPRDSPASIPSSANSPAKFEVPIRSTPSPAKSESPSLKPRSSPAKIHLASNLKYDEWQNEQKKLQSAMFEHPKSTNSNNFILPGEDSRRTPPVSIYPLPASQSSGKKTSTSTSNNSKSNQKSNQTKNANHWLSQIPNMEDFLKQLEKGDLSVLMQSPYNLPTYSQAKEESRAAAKPYDMKPATLSSVSSNNNRKKEKPVDPFSSLGLDAFKGNSEKLLNLMKSPEYTQMLLKSAKMSNIDIDSLEKLSAPYSQSPQRGSSSGSSSSRQSQHESKSSRSSQQQQQQQQASYYPPFDMKYFNEMSKQSSNSKKNFNPTTPEDFNALLQMELFSKHMAPNQGQGYGKSSHTSMSQSRAEEARKAEKQQQQQLDALYGIPANLRNYMYDMPQQQSSPKSSSSKSTKSQSSSSKQSYNNQSSSSSSHYMKEKSNDMKHGGYNAADIMKLNSFLGGSSKDAAMLHPLYNDYYAQSLGLLNAQAKGAMSGGESTSSSKNSNFAQMMPSQLHAMSSLFPGTKPSDLEAILKNSYFSDQMMKAQRDMIEACSKATKSSSSSPYKKSETTTQKKDPPPPSQSELEMSLQKSMENVANSIFKYGDLGGFSRSYSATSTDSSRKSLSQSPVDFVAKERSIPPKKRMEFSSIAELSSSSKKPKYDDNNTDNSFGGGALNLSSK